MCARCELRGSRYEKTEGMGPNNGAGGRWDAGRYAGDEDEINGYAGGC